MSTTALEDLLNAERKNIKMSDESLEICLSKITPDNINDTDILGRTALLLAIPLSLSCKLVQKLLEMNADPNISDSKGYTPLMMAVLHKQQLVEFLITKRANVNHTNTISYTALMFAIYHRPNFEVVKLLLENGANINTYSPIRSSLLIHVCINSKYPQQIEIARLLIEYGADIHGTYSGDPIFLIAIKNRNFELMLLFLEKKIVFNINHIMYCGKTALIIASLNGDINICKLLVENGANLHIQDTNGFTAFFCAILSGNLELCIYLLDKDNDLIKNKTIKDDTALHVACRRKDLEISKWISEHLDQLDIIHLNNDNKSAIQVWGCMYTDYLMFMHVKTESESESELEQLITHIEIIIGDSL